MPVSAFNQEEQNTHLDSRIVVAMERIAEAFRVLLWQEGQEHGLSTIQAQLLVFLAFHPPALSRVTYLAREFNLTKPTISDAVRALERKGLVERVPNERDARSFHLRLSAGGRQTAQQLALFSEALKAPVTDLSEQTKAHLWEGLLSIITALQKSGIITVQRMCYSCRFYRAADGAGYCALLEKALAAERIRLDCPEHQPAG